MIHVWSAKNEVEMLKEIISIMMEYSGRLGKHFFELDVKNNGLEVKCDSVVSLEPISLNDDRWNPNWFFSKIPFFGVGKR